MSDTITDPCEYGDALGRHRWKRDQPTHHITPEGEAILDDFCIRCNQWATDVIHPKGGYPPLPDFPGFGSVEAVGYDQQEDDFDILFGD